MKTMFAYSPSVIYLILIAVLLIHRVILRLRYASLPKAVSDAVDMQFPNTRTLAVMRNDLTGTFQIELTDYCNDYLVEVRPDGKIVNIECDPLFDDSTVEEAETASDGQLHATEI